ncbi:MAG: hypothetical protein U0168_20125 [Nannocystaceae bacterium]
MACSAARCSANAASSASIATWASARPASRASRRRASSSPWAMAAGGGIELAAGDAMVHGTTGPRVTRSNAIAEPSVIASTCGGS